MAQNGAFPSPETLLRGYVRIFLSCDIVGSTAYKQRQEKASASSPSSSDWLLPFISFYRETGAAIILAEARVNESLTKCKLFKEAGDPIEFWKGAGDELLFSRRIKSRFEALASVLAFRDAVRTQRAGLKQQVPPLNLKATAWLAGFPVNNSEVVLGLAPEAPRIEDTWIENLLELHDRRSTPTGRDSLKVDFLGPSIDLGFRLCAHSTPQEMAVSADLALLLTRCCKEIAAFSPARKGGYLASNETTLGFRGSVELKGILGGSNYPVFYVRDDKSDDLYDLEATLRGIENPTLESIEEYLNSYLNPGSALRMKPYFLDGLDDEFADIPPTHKERIANFRDRIAGQISRIEQSGIKDSVAKRIQAAETKVVLDVAGRAAKRKKPTSNRKLKGRQSSKSARR